MFSSEAPFLTLGQVGRSFRTVGSFRAICPTSARCFCARYAVGGAWASPATVGGGATRRSHAPPGREARFRAAVPGLSRVSIALGFFLLLRFPLIFAFVIRSPEVAASPCIPGPCFRDLHLEVRACPPSVSGVCAPAGSVLSSNARRLTPCRGPSELVCVFRFFVFFSRETRFLVSSMFSIQGISLWPWLP